MYSTTSLHRALLQSETQALDDRISEPYGVREPGGISLSECHPNRVQARHLWRLQILMQIEFRNLA
jgi:hypothetical protein